MVVQYYVIFKQYFNLLIIGLHSDSDSDKFIYMRFYNDLISQILKI